MKTEVQRKHVVRAHAVGYARRQYSSIADIKSGRQAAVAKEVAACMLDMIGRIEALVRNQPYQETNGMADLADEIAQLGWLSGGRNSSPAAIAKKLTVGQRKWVLELAESNDNPENEWRIGGRGSRRACASLREKGLAWQPYLTQTDVYALTDLGRAVAVELEKS